MTAEVIIANANGVALAADSAVTIGGNKIYNSAIKLFSISKTEPVGIMIYGNATLMDVPWEILIKEFRKELGVDKCDELEGYGEKLISFLCAKKCYFPDQSQRTWIETNIKGYYTLIREDYFNGTHPILQKNGEIRETESMKLFQDIVSKHYNNLKKEKNIKDIGADFEEEFKKKYASLFKEISDSVFQNIKISDNSRTQLNNIAVYIHTKERFSESRSGIVIAGYGDKEIYPSILTYEIEGVIEGKLRYRLIEDKCRKIKSGNEGVIIPFAQDDMVSLFMNGVNPKTITFIIEYITLLLNRIPELLDDTYLKANKDEINRIKSIFKDRSKHLLEGFFKDFSDYIYNNHFLPVMNMIEVLPKDELSNMAEALVNLTAFKRRMSNSLETVGGPIDVAVISKGDGLVWVKRKHYFPSELNQHFFANYFREVSKYE